MTKAVELHPDPAIYGSLPPPLKAAVEGLLEACQNAPEKQIETLKSSFEKSHGTFLFERQGIQYKEGDDVLQLLQKLPLTTYDDYAPVIDAIVAAAESDCSEQEYVALQQKLASGPGDKLWAFITTSGTTGKSKKCPMFISMNPWFQAHGAVWAGLQNTLLGSVKPNERTLRFGFSFPVKNLKGVWVAPAGAILAARYMKMQSMMPPDAPQPPLARTSPYQIMLSASAREAAYLHWLAALVQADTVAIIECVFASGVLNAVAVLEEYWQSMANDLESGKLNPGCPLTENVPEEARNALYHPERGLLRTARPDVAQALRVNMAGGTAGLLKRLFPALRATVAVTSGGFTKYIPRLRNLLGPEVLLASMDYSSSEAQLGLQIDVLDPAQREARCLRELDTGLQHLYVPLPHNGIFYEFIPEEDMKLAQPRVLKMHELEVGKRYEPVVTIPTGWWRYRHNDLIEVQGYYGKAPLFTVVGRAGLALDIISEKTTEAHLRGAITDAAALLPNKQVDLIEVTAMEDTAHSPCRYVVVQELAPGLSLGEEALQQYADKLEYCLSRRNGLYGLSRFKLMVAPLELRIVASGTFAKVAAAAVAAGTDADQFKVQLVTRSPMQLAIINDNVVARAVSSVPETELPTITDE